MTLHNQHTKDLDLYVRKRWSENPALWHYIKLSDALKLYEEYIEVVMKSPFSTLKNLTEFYNFEDWLEYEICTSPKELKTCNLCGRKSK